MIFEAVPYALGMTEDGHPWADPAASIHLGIDPAGGVEFRGDARVVTSEAHPVRA
jgi:hypothetical protein